jgi:hypothetical protein
MSPIVDTTAERRERRAAAAVAGRRNASPETRAEHRRHPRNYRDIVWLTEPIALTAGFTAADLAEVERLAVKGAPVAVVVGYDPTAITLPAFIAEHIGGAS